jgi:hypothetical protein
MLTLALALLAQAHAAPQATPDPLAPARAGKVQCIGPSREKKTCLGMASFKPGAGNTFESTVAVLVSPNPLIVMETHAKGTVEGGGICNIIRAEDYAASTFTLNGAPMDESTAATIRPQVAATIAPMAGKKGCSRERPDGDVLVSEVTIDGVARPDMTQKVIWVSPTDGYTLGMP